MHLNVQVSQDTCCVADGDVCSQTEHINIRNSVPRIIAVVCRSLYSAGLV